MSLNKEKQNIIFFDGVCNLCNSFVSFVIERDKIGTFHFCSLQDPIAIDLLGERATNLDTVILLKKGETHQKADAAIEVLSELGFFWRWLKIFKLFPLKNLCYDFIAKNRYRFFGKQETCRLPTPEEKSRFL